MIHPVPGSYYIYAPVHGASIAFAILFFTSGLLHIYQNNIKSHSWRIGFLFPWAASCFVAGFCLREYTTWHYDTLNVFIASQVFLFIAPPVYNGANYVLFSRALYYIPYHSPLHPGRVFSTFIFIDTVAGILAGNGAARLANADATPSERHTGLTLIRASLILLLFLSVSFLVLIGIFHYRLTHRTPRTLTPSLRTIIMCLYVSTFLIMLRNTFRTAASFYGPLTTANAVEWPFWVLEAVPMVINTFLFNIFPPSNYLPKNYKIYLARDGVTEIEGDGKVDDRPRIMTFVDPFDIVGLIQGRGKERKGYWETGQPSTSTRTAETQQMGREAEVSRVDPEGVLSKA